MIIMCRRKCHSLQPLMSRYLGFLWYWYFNLQLMNEHQMASLCMRIIANCKLFFFFMKWNQNQNFQCFKLFVETNTHPVRLSNVSKITLRYFKRNQAVFFCQLFFFCLLRASWVWRRFMWLFASFLFSSTSSSKCLPKTTVMKWPPAPPGTETHHWLFWTQYIDTAFRFDSHFNLTSYSSGSWSTS